MGPDNPATLEGSGTTNSEIPNLRTQVRFGTSGIGGTVHMPAIATIATGASGESPAV